VCVCVCVVGGVGRGGVCPRTAAMTHTAHHRKGHDGRCTPHSGVVKHTACAAGCMARLPVCWVLQDVSELLNDGGRVGDGPAHARGPTCGSGWAPQATRNRPAGVAGCRACTDGKCTAWQHTTGAHTHTTHQSCVTRVPGCEKVLSAASTRARYAPTCRSSAGVCSKQVAAIGGGCDTVPGCCRQATQARAEHRSARCAAHLVCCRLERGARQVWQQPRHAHAAMRRQLQPHHLAAAEHRRPRHLRAQAVSCQVCCQGILRLWRGCERGDTRPSVRRQQQPAQWRCKPALPGRLRARTRTRTSMKPRTAEAAALVTFSTWRLSSAGTAHTQPRVRA
jgi:hypothetical protein